MSKKPHCAEKVFDRYGSHTCMRSPIAGSRFCRQHDPATVAARRAIADAKVDHRMRGYELATKRDAALEALLTAATRGLGRTTDDVVRIDADVVRTYVHADLAVIEHARGV